MKSYDAIVIGAGPAGGTTSLCLARAGWSVAVVEKAEFPRAKVCGEFMSATNAPLFADLGLADFIDHAAGPQIRRVGLFAREEVLEAAMPRMSGATQFWGRALGRDKLDTLLLERAQAAGAELWQPWSAAELRREADVSICTLTRKGESAEIAAPIVIAAHGSWERGGLPTQIQRAHRASDLLAFKAHFHGAALAGDLMPLIVFPGGYGGMVTSDSGRVSLTLCIRRDTLQRARETSGLTHAADAVIAHVAHACRGVREAIAGAEIEGNWLAAGPINPGIRPRYSGGVFRVGNSAGEAHPVVAEGLSMAMQSGWLVGSLLVNEDGRARRGAALDAIGAAYASSWHAHFAPRIRAAAVFAHLSMRPATTGLLLPLVSRFPKLLTFGARLSGKTRATEPVLSALAGV
ncbi:MAG: NAD(P)/FAD-dependent oxidoreductase [Hyphomicrobiales bacterium]|nr:NAD(P)/FAD-dependent oxidoreductase [Hyphomicrobiales bacterium]